VTADAGVHSDPPAQTGKLKKPPPITPRRFNRFFSPRSSASRVSKPSTKAAKQLQDITRNAINRITRSSPRKSVIFADVESQENVDVLPTGSSSKKRKALPTPTSSPPQSSPCKRPRRSSALDIPSSPPILVFEPPSRSPSPKFVDGKRIVRIGHGALGISGRILERSMGGYDCLGRGLRRDHCITWRMQTSDFYSQPEDRHEFAHPALPFCSTSCNTNSLTAIGDEAGGIRLIDSESASFNTTHMALQPHSNAIIDMAFSSDDYLLATASGDQTTRIIDMKMQMSKFVLQGHYTSVKQVRFQPGNDNVIATSSRDGDINIWDLRCSPTSSVVKEFKVTLDPSTALDIKVPHKVAYSSIYNTISGAHSNNKALTEISNNVTGGNSSNDASKPERYGEVSVTALEFLSVPGREHLLLSGSEASTMVRLWDIRSRYSRRGPSTPISTTMQPESHNKHRQFGISSLVLSSNNSRLYALSRDNTLYAYATSHLILGHVPELSSSAPKPKYSGESRTGLGPIYGFRHAKFHATSFYVKAALRPAKGDKPELVAVGSSDQCAVVFPTDETAFRYAQARAAGAESDPLGAALDRRDEVEVVSSPSSGRRPTLRRSASGLSLRMTDTIPIFEVGRALVGAHEREVTSLTWAFGGELVTVGDDYRARRWCEDAARARDLRVGGETGGRRWNCGWAEVEEPGYDDYDDE